ncbi:hypothetical protein ACFP3Q_16740 [Nocardioides sp. GCM10027113]|uniref:hypothetical protein n=1 Tax=unclassified Nocardioides TaxID=2615069 RepID=UPI00361AF254
MTEIRSTASAAAALAVLAVTATACGGGGDRVDHTGAAVLERQRAEVRATAVALATDLSGATGGEVQSATGDWDGCEPAFADRFAGVRYAATVRLSLAGWEVPPRQRAEVLAELLGDPAEGAGDTGALVRTAPDGHEALVEVTAPCVEVPAGERDAWLVREEPTPDLPVPARGR